MSSVIRSLQTCAMSFLMVALMILTPIGLVQSGSSEAQWTQRGIIFIDGDSQFTSANGVVAGTGISSDPYIIQGWQIGPNDDLVAITITDTRAYFTINDVNLLSSSIGISLNNVSHAIIQNSRMANLTIGVSLYHCRSIKITSSTFEDDHIAISISYSDASQSGNTFVNNQVDVTKLEKKVPLIETWVGAAICVAILIPLLIFISLLVYFRIKHKSMEP